LKLFPLIKELKKYPTKYKLEIIKTGQHDELVDDVFKLFDIKPNFDFGVMEYCQNLASLSSKLIAPLTNCFLALEPDVIFIQGDTSSAFIAALGAYYASKALIHIEAGLRTHFLFNPYPEEMNRCLISTLAGFHFAPTQRAKENLIKENTKPEQIFVVGNTIIDTLKLVLKDYITDNIKARFPKEFEGKDLFLVTAQRRENYEQFANIRLALEKLAETSKRFMIVMPLHPNPKVQDAFSGMKSIHFNIKIIPPLSYPEFIYYMTKCKFLITDSGGLVEEASYLGKPVLILRDVTERPESVDAGIARTIGTQSSHIYNTVIHYFSCGKDYKEMARKELLYGDGTAAQQIVKILEEKIL